MGRRDFLEVSQVGKFPHNQVFFLRASLNRLKVINLVGGICLRELPVQQINALLQLPNLQSKMKRTRVNTCLLHKAKVRRVPTEFNVGAMCSSLQSSLGNL